MRMSYRMEGERLKLALIVKNLLVSHAEEPAGVSVPDDYPLERRSLWAPASYGF